MLDSLLKIKCKFCECHLQYKIFDTHWRYSQKYYCKCYLEKKYDGTALFSFKKPNTYSIYFFNYFDFNTDIEIDINNNCINIKKHELNSNSHYEIIITSISLEKLIEKINNNSLYDFINKVHNLL